MHFTAKTNTKIDINTNFEYIQMNNIYNFPLARDRPIETCTNSEHFQILELKT